MPSEPARTDVRAVVLVHSSDLHIDDHVEQGRYHGLDGLCFVLAAAEAVNADAVLLAGDTFDHVRVGDPVVRRATAVLAGAGMPVVLLPGNHDPLFAESIYQRSGMLELDHVTVLGHAPSESIVLEALDLEILGRPHRSYADMKPLPAIAPRKARWQVIMAHGHFVPPADWADDAHRSWLISEADIAGTGVDYIALGHWDRPTAVGNGKVPAYYSGAPDLAQTVNVVRLDPSSGVSVERRALDMPFAKRW